MNIFIDPAYKAYYQGELFNAQNKVLNRDDSLSPFIRMHDLFAQSEIQVQTADLLLGNSSDNLQGHYYSFGLLDNLSEFSQRDNLKLKAFVIMEPPVIAPHLYNDLPRLTRLFDRVYVHNTVGDGYSLEGVITTKLRKFYWPQPYKTALEKYWTNTNRQNRVVVINGNHKPVSYAGELYSKRIEAIVQLKQLDFVDLYGRGWSKRWSRSSWWLPYWKHRRSLLSVYKGACVSKLELLSQYDFSLCFENMQLQGYVTEKIFDCFYAGTVPIYWGAKDINALIPVKTYIDFRNFKNYAELKLYLSGMSDKEIMEYKLAAQDFLRSTEGLKYYDSIANIIEMP